MDVGLRNLRIQLTDAATEVNEIPQMPLSCTSHASAVTMRKGKED